MAPQTSEELSALCERAFAQAAKLQSLGRGRMEAALDRGQLEITADLLHQLAKHAAYREVASEATTRQLRGIELRVLLEQLGAVQAWMADTAPAVGPDVQRQQAVYQGLREAMQTVQGGIDAWEERYVERREREALEETARQVPVVTAVATGGTGLAGRVTGGKALAPPATPDPMDALDGVALALEAMANVSVTSGGAARYTDAAALVRDIGRSSQQAGLYSLVAHLDDRRAAGRGLDPLAAAAVRSVEQHDALEAARAEGHKAGRAQGHREAAELLREDAANRYEVVKTLGRTADILERGGEGAG